MYICERYAAFDPVELCLVYRSGPSYCSPPMFHLISEILLQRTVLWKAAVNCIVERHTTRHLDGVCCVHTSWFHNFQLPGNASGCFLQLRRFSRQTSHAESFATSSAVTSAWKLVDTSKE